MKQTQLKDASRNIKKQKVSFISIVVIAMLAVAAYLGINFGGIAIQQNSNRFFDETNFRDAEVISTKLLTEEDRAALRDVPGVAEAEGLYFTSAHSRTEKGQTPLNIVSLTNKINTPKLLAGSLPQKETECLLDQSIAEKLGLDVGSVIEVENHNGGAPEFIKQKSFTVSGIMLYAEHPSREIQVPGNRNMAVLPEAFTEQARENGYMRMLLLFDYEFGKSKDRHSDSYKKESDAVMERIDALAGERENLRDAEIHARYQKEIDQAAAQLENAKKELADSRAQLDKGWAEAAENQKKIEDAEKQLETSAAELEEAKNKISEGESQLKDSEIKLKEGEEELAKGRAVLDESAQKIKESEKQLSQAAAQLEAGRRELRAAEAELAAGEKKLAEGKKQLDAGETELSAAKAQLDAAAAEIKSGQKQLDEAEAALRQGYDLIEEQKENIREQARKVLTDALISVNVDKTAAADIISTLPWTRKGTLNLDDASIDMTVFGLLNGVSVKLEPVDYMSAVRSTLTRFDEIFDEILKRAEARGVDITSIVDGRQKIRQQLENGLTSAEKLENDYNSRVSQLRSWNGGHADYLSGRDKLAEGKAQYEAGKKTYESGAAQAEAARKEYREAARLYEEGKKAYLSGKETLEAKEKIYNYGVAAFREGQAKYKEGEAQYQASLKEYEDGKALYEKSLAEYEEGKKKYEDGLVQYEKGLAQLEEGKLQLEEGEEQLLELERQYKKGEKEYANGEAALDKARRELADLADTAWVNLDVGGNTCFALIHNAANAICNVGRTFALVFIFVAALVIYATVGRIVDEQRRLVGATKALGLYNREILGKYLCFGVTATVLGMFLGLLAASFLIQPIITSGYGQFLAFDNSRLTFHTGMAAVVVAGGIVLSSATIWWACRELLKSPATVLMQEKAPPARKSKKTKSSRSLYTKLIFLNMSLDKKRVAVTIASVAGCCILLVTGFSLRASILEAIDREFKDVVTYDSMVEFDPRSSAYPEESMEKIMKEEGVSYIHLLDASVMFRGDDGILRNAELICGDLSGLDDFFVRRDAATGELLPSEAEGIFLYKKLAEIMKLKPGDTITVYDEAMRGFSVPVAGIFNCYFGHDIIISESSYRHVYGRLPEMNAFFVKGDKDALGRAVGRLETTEGVRKITSIGDLRNTYQNMTKILNLIVVVLIIVAGMMAYFILLNLAVMYVNQKKTELTVMRINGFTVREVIRYVAGESVATTVIGILLGLVLGTILFLRVNALLESTTVQLIRHPEWPSLIYAALITGLFAFLVYTAATRKVKNLKLTDI